jgi:beta-phosphoglucomutase-like phosphatase (HAD superfamily)
MKAIIYDLDGVLVDSVGWHEIALNRALQEVVGFQIGGEEIETLRGQPTRDKLHTLLGQKKLTQEQLVEVLDLKKKHFDKVVEDCACEDSEKIKLLEETHRLGLCTACVTNSNRAAATSVLSSTGLLGGFDVVITGSEVNNPKPCSEGYVIAMVLAGALPRECIIVEDTVEGVVSARNTGAYVWEVRSPVEVTCENLNRFLKELR